MKLRKIETNNKVVQILNVTREQLHYLYNNRQYITKFIRLDNIDEVNFELFINVDADTFERWLVENNLLNTTID